MRNRGPRTWRDSDPVEDARLHARSIALTLCELKLAKAINDPSLADAYDIEIKEVGQALFNAKQKVAALEARRSQS